MITTLLVFKVGTEAPFTPIRLFALRTAKRFLSSVKKFIGLYNSNKSVYTCKEYSLKKGFSKQTLVRMIEDAGKPLVHQVNLFIECIVDGFMLEEAPALVTKEFTFFFVMFCVRVADPEETSDKTLRSAIPGSLHSKI